MTEPGALSGHSDTATVTRWAVGFDDERVATFTDEESAIAFAHFDSQLANTTAVVLRIDDDGTATVVAEFVR